MRELVEAFHAQRSARAVRDPAEIRSGVAVHHLRASGVSDSPAGCNRRAIEACSVRVDDAGPRMRRISQRLAEQACGRRGIAPPREHEVDRGASGIDGSVKVAPTAPDTNLGLIDTPGPIGGLEMTAQPLLQFGTVVLDPAPDGRVVRFQAALAEGTSARRTESTRAPCVAI